MRTDAARPSGNVVTVKRSPQRLNATTTQGVRCRRLVGHFAPSEDPPHAREVACEDAIDVDRSRKLTIVKADRRGYGMNQLDLLGRPELHARLNEWLA